MNKILFHLLVLGLISFGHAQDLEYSTKSDISYISNTEHSKYKIESCLLDIYFPTNKIDVPVIVWFHGGGLTSGVKEIPESLKNKGVCVVGVGYRLSPQVEAKMAINDAVAAIAWVIKNIDKYNGNKNAVFVSGHSAGGYLALMSVMDVDRLKKHDIDANSIAGLIPFSGHTITHFTIRNEMGVSGGTPIIDKYAPLFFVRKKAPPILLITGDRDLELLGRYEENAYFYRMMKVNGHHNINIYEMDGYGHDMVEPALPLLLKFMNDVVSVQNEIPHYEK